MKKEKNDLDQMYQKLQEEDDPNDIKKWYEAIIPKFILLFPLLIFLITFLRINNDKSFVDLFNFILVASMLVLFGVALNFILTKK